MLKTYTPQELADILALHRKWLNGSTEGRPANLRDSDLSYSDLSYRDLSGSDLSDSDLSGSDLSYSNLSYSDLSGSDLSGSDLSYSNLRDSNLRDSKTDEKTRLPAFLIVPQMGEFVAWKKASGAIVQIAIPADAHRCSTPIGRKCRAEFVRALSIDGDTTPGKSVSGDHDPNTIYTVGEITRADKYDDDWRVECTHGIHFFMTREEAEEY